MTDRITDETITDFATIILDSAKMQHVVLNPVLTVEMGINRLMQPMLPTTTTTIRETK